MTGLRQECQHIHAHVMLLCPTSQISIRPKMLIHIFPIISPSALAYGLQGSLIQLACHDTPRVYSTARLILLNLPGGPSLAVFVSLVGLRVDFGSSLSKKPFLAMLLPDRSPSKCKFRYPKVVPAPRLFSSSKSKKVSWIIM